MSRSRRSFFQDAMLFGAGLFGLSTRLSAATNTGTADKTTRHQPRGGKSPDAPRIPMVTPDVPDLPFEMDGGVKVFRLKAAPMKQKIAPFKTIDVWGYSLLKGA